MADSDRALGHAATRASGRARSTPAQRQAQTGTVNETQYSQSVEARQFDDATRPKYANTATLVSSKRLQFMDRSSD